MNMFVHVFWEWKQVPMPSSIFHEDGHFHLPHFCWVFSSQFVGYLIVCATNLPNTFKSHHYFVRHTINIHMQYGHSRFRTPELTPKHKCNAKVRIKMIFLFNGWIIGLSVYLMKGLHAKMSMSRHPSLKNFREVFWWIYPWSDGVSRKFPAQK